MLKGLANLSKEEKELMIQQKMEMMRKKNEEIMKRHAEIEEDKKSADVFSIAVAHHRKANPVQIIPVERKQNPRPRTQRKLEEQGRVTNSDQHLSQDGENKRPQRLSAGDGPPPDPSYNYLSDPFREGNAREDRGANNHNNNNNNRGNNRHPQNKFGNNNNQDYRNTRQGGGGGGGQRKNFDREHSRDQQRLNRNDAPSNKIMSGRERNNYENWKAERQKIDEERIARQKTPSGEWRREWDIDKRLMIDEEAQDNQAGGFFRRPSWERGRGNRASSASDNSKSYNNHNSDHSNYLGDRHDGNAGGRGRGHNRGRGGGGDHRTSSHDDHQSSAYNMSERGRGRGQARGGMRGGHGGGRGYPRGILPKRLDRWSSGNSHSDNLGVDPQGEEKAWLEEDVGAMALAARDVTVNVDNTLTVSVKTRGGGTSSSDEGSVRQPFHNHEGRGGRGMVARTNAKNVGSGRIRPPLPSSHPDDRQQQNNYGRGGSNMRGSGRGGGRGAGRGGRDHRGGPPLRKFNRNDAQSSSTQPADANSSMVESDWENDLLNTSDTKDQQQTTATADAGTDASEQQKEWELTEQQLQWQNSDGGGGEWEVPDGSNWKPSSSSVATDGNEDSWEDVTSGGESLDLSGQSEEVMSKTVVQGEQQDPSFCNSLQPLNSKDDGVFVDDMSCEADAQEGDTKPRSVSLASGYEEEDEDEEADSKSLENEQDGSAVHDDAVIDESMQQQQENGDNVPDSQSSDIDVSEKVPNQDQEEIVTDAVPDPTDAADSLSNQTAKDATEPDCVNDANGNAMHTEESKENDAAAMEGGDKETPPTPEMKPKIANGAVAVINDDAPAVNESEEGNDKPKPELENIDEADNKQKTNEEKTQETSFTNDERGQELETCSASATATTNVVESSSDAVAVVT